jgi:hypothetical protein
MSKKIALYKPRYVSLTQVFPVLITDSLGSPALTEDGNLLGFDYSKRHEIYIDANTILGLRAYFELGRDKVINSVHQLLIDGMAEPICITNISFNAVKSIMNQTDLGELYEDGCNCF